MIILNIVLVLFYKSLLITLLLIELNIKLFNNYLFFNFFL